MSGTTTAGAASWPRFALPHGTTVNGYTIERVLGSGGFGVTYLARDDLGQSFAIKEYFPREFATREDTTVTASSDEHQSLFDDCLSRFRREAQALVRLGRPSAGSHGIVRAVTYFTAQGTGFLVMEYIEGTTVADVLRQNPGGLPPERVDSLLSQLLSGVDVVHQAGLLHRDIKPGNIIMRDDGRVVLIDFGSSREAATGLTRTYTQIYSTGYAPLEQMIGLPQGPFSDIYAIGAVCYHAIGGKMVDAVTRHLAQSSGQPDPQLPAEQIGAGRYPMPLLKAIDAAVAINPTQRPQNVVAMLAILGQADPAGETMIAAPSTRPSVPPTQLPASPPLTTPPSLPTASVAPAPPPESSRRGRWILALLVGAVVLAGAAYFVPWNVITGHDAQRQQAAQQQAAQQQAAQQQAAQQQAAQQQAAQQEAAQQEAARQEAAKQQAAQQQAAQQQSAQQQSAQQQAAQQQAAQQQAAQQQTAQQQAAQQQPAQQPAAQQQAAQQREPQQQPAAQQPAEQQSTQTPAPDQDTSTQDTGNTARACTTLAGVNAAPVIRNIDTQRAIPACERAIADHPTPRLQFQLGRAYLAAGRFDDAARVDKLAADRGIMYAQVDLGRLYAEGRGVPQSWTEAARLYKLAADRGFALAQVDLGRLYESGKGVPQSWPEAARLFTLGADRGYPLAQVALARLYESGRGVQQSWTEAARLFKLSADQGDAPAQFELGRLYEDGRGVPQSWPQALRLYTLAADQGNEPAKSRLRAHNQ